VIAVTSIEPMTSHEGDDPTEVTELAPSRAAPPLLMTLPAPLSLAENARFKPTRNTARRRYLELCDRLASMGAIPPVPEEPLRGVVVHVTLFVRSRVRADEAAQRSEPALQWLVERGYLLSDRLPHVRVPWPECRLDRTRSTAYLQIRISPDGRAAS
jgi:hypothetical protein